MAKHPPADPAESADSAAADKHATALTAVTDEIATIAATPPARRSPAQNARLQELEIERQRLVKAAE